MSIFLTRLKLRWHRWWFNYHLRSAAVHIARADVADWRVREALGNLCILENDPWVT